MLITMSDKEIQRLAVLQDVRDHRITQVRAAEILNLSTRQITRLLHKLKQDGVSPDTCQSWSTRSSSP
jgi:DNA-binding Lrp family transcriptional regulator